jgi:hypothetical protein
MAAPLVNHNIEPVQSRSRRQLNRTDQSTKSGASDDLEETGWIFHQLGYLEYMLDEMDFEMETDAATKEWERTDTTW